MKITFRKFPEGDIIALFPDEKWSEHEDSIMSYQHLGQHGDASKSLLTLPYATKAEYESLLRELVDVVGYDNLEVINADKRLEELRAELRAERISYGEIAELQSLKDYIQPGDVELLEAAGVPEFTESIDLIASGYEWECPECEHLNHEIEITEYVQCKECHMEFRVDEAHHAHG